jgi:ABC-type lipoprotein release transport system permease subunit
MDGPTAHIIPGEGRCFENTGEIILGKGVLDYLQTQELSWEQIQQDPSFDTTDISGNPVPLTVVGAFETGSMFTDNGVYSDIATARTLSELASNKVSQIIVKADSYENVDAVAEAIGAQLPDNPSLDIVIAKDLLG